MNNVLFDGKIVCITGGTGSLGTALTKKLLDTDVDTIRIFSRDEWKQLKMKSDLNDKRLRFLIGDVRDKERLARSLEDVDIVIHAAALKQVPVAEYNPFEAVKTNVYGAQNLIESSLDKGVKLVLAVGTDKAVSPFNTYGATKLLMERLFISANNYKGNNEIKFTCVRYGNVLGSRGSVVPVFLDQIKSGKKITITDPEMTRFNITMNEATQLIYRAIENGIGGDVFIPKLKSYRLEDLKNALLELSNSNLETELVNVRIGEKFHESLISNDEIRNTYETEHDYVLYDKSNPYRQNEKIEHLLPTSLTGQYSSDKVSLLSVEEIKTILTKEKLV